MATADGVISAQATLVGGTVGTDGFRCGGWEFLTVGVVGEHVGGRELLSVGQVDQVTAAQP
jgi:hypothetical protein